MDAAAAKVEASATALIAELDAGLAAGGPDMRVFKTEVAALLGQLTTSGGNYAALADKGRALNSELDAARRVLAEVRQEEEDLAASMKHVQEDTARLAAEAAKAKLAAHTHESAIADARARIAALEAHRDAGSGWSPDQVKQQNALEVQRAALAKELETRRSVLVNLRAEVAQLAGHLERAQAEKGEADRAIGEIKDEITSMRAAAVGTARAKEIKDRELKEAQDGVVSLHATLAEKAARAEAGTADVAAAQEALKRDKAALDRCLKEYDRLRQRAGKLTEELDGQMRGNQALAAELNALSEAAAASRIEAARLKRDAARATKLQALTLAKIDEAEERRAAAEAQRSELARHLEEVEAAVEAEGRRNDVKRAAVDDATREKEVLTKGLAKAGEKSRAAAEVVVLQGATRRNLEAEIGGYGATVRRLRGEIDELQGQRAQYAASCDEAAQAYFTAVEGVKLQELQIAALQRKIEEGSGKLKQQQALYEAVRADRNMYSKSLVAAHADIGDMRRTFRTLKRSIEALKEEITAKDHALVKEHFEHHRVEKEKEALRHEVTRVQKQVQSCDHIVVNQEGEAVKLAAVIAEADAERARQAKEYDAVLAERNLLQGQLVRRDGELSALYEKLRVQKSALANGASAFAKRAAERDDMGARVAALKGELLVAQTQTNDGSSLAAEAKRLEADLTNEKTKIRALTEELERPLNIHRWRTLADRDPERWAVLQRVHALQRRLVEARDEIRAREALIADREKTYAEVKASLARQPGPEAVDAVASYQANLKTKAKQLRQLEAELESYRGKVGDYRRELARVDEAMDGLAQAYIRRQRAERKRRSVAPGMLGGYGGYGGGGASMDEAALEAAMAADGGFGGGGAGGSSGSAGGPRLSATAVHDEADELLAAYADVLGGDAPAAGGAGYSAPARGGGGGAYAEAEAKAKAAAAGFDR
jgi:chromosome segregation ATPase